MKTNLQGGLARPLTPERSDGERGQTLLETLLALSVSVFILGAITTVVISSLNSAQFTKNQNLAGQYAREGMEIVRKIRDSGTWTAFSGIDGIYCLSSGSASLPSSSASCPPPPNIAGIFIREINIISNSSDCPSATPPNGTKVTSKVSWTDGKCPPNVYCHKAEITSCLHRLDTITAP